MLFSKLTNVFVTEKEQAFALPDIARVDRQDMEKSYARLFSSEDGKRVLSHLQSISFMRAYGAEASDAQIRYAEGQRALVTTIMRMVSNGRSSSNAHFT